MAATIVYHTTLNILFQKAACLLYKKYNKIIVNETRSGVFVGLCIIINTIKTFRYAIIIVVIAVVVVVVVAVIHLKQQILGRSVVFSSSNNLHLYRN